ncbi:hypothetical protein ACFOGJ_28275 [Marinibaculum pumilum]|uniref:Uncharacterized protein n=1 Tax=Marinibaculum pumilum TaxID=1766165 RepID=A0ABV7L9Z1_9PROT
MRLVLLRTALPAVALSAIALPAVEGVARELRADPAPAARELTVGSAVSGSLAIGPFTVPLPPGDWTVYYTETATSNDRTTRTEKVALIALDGDTMTQEIYARADVKRDRKGFQAFPYCRDASYFHEAQRSNLHTRGQDCWHVRAESLVEREDAGPRFQALYAKADKENLFLPAASVGSRFHFADRDALLRVAYSWNPELVLRSRGDDKVWLAADWSKGEVSQDPRRMAVMRIMQRWGADWYERVKAAFETGAADIR